MIRYRIKRKYYYGITILLILFFAFLVFSLYSARSSNKINMLSQEYFQKTVYNNLNQTVVSTMTSKEIEDVLEIFMNNQNEILYVDYNLNESYKLLDEVSQKIKNSFNNDIIYKVPFLIGSDNVFLSNWGPQITIKISYINSILTNLYTKITNYGLNNALVEAYIKITVEGRIVTPVSQERKIVNYDLLVSSKIINGRVPNVYGNYLTSSSSIFDIPIN